MIEFIPIGTTPDWWIWSLQAFNGKQYVGTYEMHGPKIYSHPPWEHLVTFSPNGESIINPGVFKNKLYVASEDMGCAGKIYRMDSPTNWTSVHRETTWYPNLLAILGDYFYSVWHNEAGDVKLLRTSDGISWKQVALWHKVETFYQVLYNDQLYLLGAFLPSQESWAIKTSDGINWAEVSPLCHHTYPSPWFGVTPFKGNLLMGQIYGKSIYKYDESKKTKVFECPKSIRGTHSCYVFDNNVYWLFGQRWKASTGNSYLYISSTGEEGDWELIQTFNKPNARSMGALNNELYLGIQNTLYKMVREEAITTTTITCPNCGSILELSISSISEKNIQQNCPLCGEPAD